MGKRNHLGYRVGEWHGRAKADDRTVRRALDMRREGRTISEIGDALGVNERTVFDWITYRTRASA